VLVESGNKVKTDRRDSRKLSQLLEKDMLKRVYVLTEEERAHRELVRTRRQIVNHRNDVARQIKSKLLLYGIKSPFPREAAMDKTVSSVVKGDTLSLRVSEDIT